MFAAGGIARRGMVAGLNLWSAIGARMPKSLKGIDVSELQVGRVLAVIMLLVAVPEVE